MLRIILAAFALAASPAAFAQQTQTEPKETPFVYLSGGLAWSGELGVELEVGFQLDLGDAFQLRFSPANISLFDGDLPPGFFWDDIGRDRTCRLVDTGQATFADECRPEPDTEWRSVIEGQLRLAPDFYVGAGATYLLQGDFQPADGRVATFASFAWDDHTGTSLELRAGREYVALQVRGLW